MLVERENRPFYKGGGGGGGGRVSEEAPPTEPISSCHKSFLLGKWGEAKCQNIWINSTEACWERGGAARGALLAQMGWRVDERVGELKKKKKKVGFGTGGVLEWRWLEGFACETASVSRSRNAS